MFLCYTFSNIIVRFTYSKGDVHLDIIKKDPKSKTQVDSRNASEKYTREHIKKAVRTLNMLNETRRYPQTRTEHKNTLILQQTVGCLRNLVKHAQTHNYNFPSQRDSKAGPLKDLSVNQQQIQLSQTLKPLQSERYLQMKYTALSLSKNDTIWGRDWPTVVSTFLFSIYIFIYNV